MCGIAGIFQSNREGAPRRVRAALEAMRHRGPDGEGTMTFAGGAAGMVRLALVDLSDRGQQPLWSDDRSVAIIFNGEMYNFREERARLESSGHRFRTATDTEVVLHLFLEKGAGCVQRMRGMFAFAIFDFREARGDEPDVVLCRGPLGMKPLYVAKCDGGIVFASEIRSILATGLVERRLDPFAVDQLLRFGFVVQPRTIIEGVRMLEPGTLERYRAGAPLESSQWWPWRDSSPAEAGSLEDAATELRQVLNESTRLHTLADAPVGAFLSGGIDSTAVVALMRPHVRTLRTFTLRFPDAPGHDEAFQAAEVARRLDCDSTIVDVTGDVAAAVFPRFAVDLDQPSSDGLNTWLVSRAAASQVKAALSGLGGDEWFGGYPVARRMMRVGSRTSGAMIRGIGRVAKEIGPLLPGRRVRSRVGDAAARSSPFDTWLHSHTVFREQEMERLRRGVDASVPQRGLARSFDRFDDGWRSRGPLEQAQLFDVRGYLLCQLLRDSDATSMAHSLEVRAPLVDVAIGRFAQRCGDAHKVSNEEGALRSKVVLTRAVQDVLSGDDPDKSPKRGFTLPYEQWMRGPMSRLLRETLTDDSIRDVGFLDVDGVRELVLSDDADSRRQYPQLWTLLTFVLWWDGVIRAAPTPLL